MRRISWSDQRMRFGVLWRRCGSFFWRRLVCLLADGSHHGEGEQDERDVTVPAMPRSRLVVVEPKFVFGSLEAVLNRPTMAIDIDQRFDRRCWGGAGIGMDVQHGSPLS